MDLFIHSDANVDTITDMAYVKFVAAAETK